MSRISYGRLHSSTPLLISSRRFTRRRTATLFSSRSTCACWSPSTSQSTVRRNGGGRFPREYVRSSVVDSTDFLRAAPSCCSLRESRAGTSESTSWSAPPANPATPCSTRCTTRSTHGSSRRFPANPGGCDLRTRSSETPSTRSWRLASAAGYTPASHRRSKPRCVRPRSIRG